ncbi:hypothetical protein PM082_006293 [Marasmius tenuissimus]|nr:hypothetical protein PM082_006293 [Marasmius tenuissimus]
MQAVDRGAFSIESSIRANSRPIVLQNSKKVSLLLLLGQLYGLRARWRPVSTILREPAGIDKDWR